MTERKSGGAKTSRSETVTVRLDPKLRYLAEIAARVQRRTLSSYIEWAVEDSLHSTVMTTKPEGGDLSVAAVNGRTPLWDVDEVDRFVILASNFPNLLTHDEQRLWKLVQETWAVLHPVQDADSPMIGFRVNLEDAELLRKHWRLFKDAADGQVPATTLAEVIKGDRRQVAVTGAAHVMRGVKAAMSEEAGVTQPPTPAKKTRKTT